MPRSTLPFSLVLLPALFLPAGAQTLPAPSLRDLQAQRLKAAQALLDVATAQFRNGTGDYSAVSTATRLVLESQLDMADTKAQRIQAAQALVTLCESQVKDVQTRIATGTVSPSQLASANYSLADVRVTLAKIQAAP